MPFLTSETGSFGRLARMDDSGNGGRFEIRYRWNRSFLESVLVCLCLPVQEALHAVLLNLS